MTFAVYARDSGTADRLRRLNTTMLVIPEAAQRLSGIHTPDRGYASRAVGDVPLASQQPHRHPRTNAIAFVRG